MVLPPTGRIPRMNNLCNTNKAKNRAILLTTLAVFCLPIISDLFINGPDRLFGYLAVDFFYYETIARNYLTLGYTTFDQTNPTNGFHPLWQHTVIATTYIAERIGLEGTQVFGATIAVSTALSLVAILLLWASLQSANTTVTPLFPWIVPGIFAVLTSFMYSTEHDFARLRVPGGERPIVGTLWHYVNGMETPLVLMFFCLALFLLTKTLQSDTEEPRRRTRLALASGVTLGALALARLDHALFSVTMTLAAFGIQQRGTRWRLWSLLAAGSLIPLAAYLLTNKVTTGAFVPVSGSVKSSFPQITTDNITDLGNILRGQRKLWVPDAWRLAQQLIPPFLAVAYVAYVLDPRTLLRGRFQLRAQRTSFDVVLLTTTPAVLGLAAYNFLFVRSDFQGHWYFPVSVLLCSLYALQFTTRTRVSSGLYGSRSLFTAWLLVSSAAISLLFYWAHFRPILNRDIAEFYKDEAPLIQNFYAQRGSPPPQFIEFYDAIFASATGFRTINGYGLVVDPEAATARKAGLDRIFELAISRGFDRVVSFNLSGERLSDNPTDNEIASVLQRYISEQTLARYDLSLEYISATRRHIIVRVEPNRRDTEVDVAQ